MTSSRLGPDLRVVLCLSCGAPVDVPLAGGPSGCAACGAKRDRSAARREPVRIGDPRAGAVDDPAQREAARLDSLRAQAARTDTDSIYDLYEAPDDCEEFEDLDADEPAAPTEAWQALRGRLEPSGGTTGPAAQRALCYAAEAVADLWRALDEPLRARATLETALERVDDAGFRHLLFCELADLAWEEDELEAAEGWLALADPAPWLLPLDSEVRNNRAFLAEARKDWAGVLAAVGMRRGDVPVSPPCSVYFHAVRVEALERLGRGREAENELALLRRDPATSEEEVDDLISSYENYPACRAVSERLAARRPPVASPPVASPPEETSGPTPPRPGTRAHEPRWVSGIPWLVIGMTLVSGGAAMLLIPQIADEETLFGLPFVPLGLGAVLAAVGFARLRDAGK